MLMLNVDFIVLEIIKKGLHQGGDGMVKKILCNAIIIFSLVIGVAWADDTHVVGNTVQLGRYEQDNDFSNGLEPIDWIVLRNDGTYVLLISKYALDCLPYNEDYTSATWETCTLRKWLNEDFLNTAFNMEEQQLLKTVTITAEANPRFTTSPGNDTLDKVFLLSISEANDLFYRAKARQCRPTNYAMNRGARLDSNTGNGWWWLRSPGFTGSIAAGVDVNGYVDDVGFFVYNTFNIVRPAIVLESHE